MVKVEQVDRDAAAAFCGVDISDGKTVKGDYNSIWGPQGYSAAVQAFAAHRIAERERCARIAEADEENDWTDGVPRGGIIADALRVGG